jgi:hypothetical protein
MDWNAKGYRITCNGCGTKSKRTEKQENAMRDFRAKADDILWKKEKA